MPLPAKKSLRTLIHYGSCERVSVAAAAAAAATPPF